MDENINLIQKNQEIKEKEEKSKEADIRKYKDIGGLSLRKLNFGLWYVEHKGKLRLAFIIFLAIISAISWVYTIYGYAHYLAKGIDEDKKILRELASQQTVDHDFFLKNAPKDLLLGPVGILKSTNNKYDFFIEMRNVNARHTAEFDYNFIVSNKEFGHSRGYILPGESKYIISLSNELEVQPASVFFRLTNISWRKLNKHDIPEWNKFRDEHFDIVIGDIKFVPARLSGLSEKVNLNHLEFNVINKTAYNYWQAEFSVLLYSGSGIAGVNKYVLDEFMSAENRHIELSWAGEFGNISKVEIYPEINIFDDNNYIKIKGGAGEEK